MLHYVHQLAANRVSLLFCGEQAVNNGCSAIFLWKQLPVVTKKTLRSCGSSGTAKQ